MISTFNAVVGRFILQSIQRRFTWAKRLPYDLGIIPIYSVLAYKSRAPSIAKFTLTSSNAHSHIRSQLLHCPSPPAQRL